MTRLYVTFAALTFFLAFKAYALETKTFTASAGVPIPTAYSTGNGSKLLVGVSNHRRLYVNNGTSSAIACTVTHSNGNTAPDQTLPVVSEEINIPATTAVTLNDLFFGKLVYCRSTTGSTITSGTVNIIGW